MGIELYPHQLDAINKLNNGNILCGGVGSGKSRTSLAYYFLREGCGQLAINGNGTYKPMTVQKNLYIITTARKRDTKEWEGELVPFLIQPEDVVIDSWNNIKKYVDVEDAFFIFDEQRVVGSGAWVKSFLKITKKNRWILLTATPGDTWSDYAPVFIANGFYKNFTDFRQKHVVYSRFTNFPKIDRYVYTGILIQLRRKILVKMDYKKEVVIHRETRLAAYDKAAYSLLMKDRWNTFENRPVVNASELCQLLRRLINSDLTRILLLKELVMDNEKTIIFYNFDYELEILRDAAASLHIPCAEWNGHKHEPIPDTDNWMYLVQYTAGAEGWNCIETNVIIFYSQSYSYKAMIQAAGRIDRMNTPYQDLYYYTLVSNAPIDKAISHCLSRKKNFNESIFVKN